MSGDLGFNKIAAAVLATGLGYMLLTEVPHFLIHAEKPDTPAYALEIPEVGAAEEEVELPFPQAEWVAAMNETDGAKVFKKCTSCHNADNGGANGTGPNLWNIVGNAAGTHAGFGYSSAMTSAGLVWDYETLDGYLEKPTRYLSGTNMNFIGLKKPEDRAAVIEYLRVRDDSPEPRPEPAVVTVPADDMVEDISAPVQEVENLEGGEGGATLQEQVEDGINDAADTIENAANDTADAVEDGAEKAVETGKDLLEKAKDAVEGESTDE